MMIHQLRLIRKSWGLRFGFRKYFYQQDEKPWKIHNIQLLILGGEITLSIKEVISKLTLWLPLLRDSVLNPTRQTVSNLLQSFLSRERGWSKILEEFRWSSQRKSIIPTIMSLPLILKWSRSVMSDSLWPHGLYVAYQAPPSMGFSRQEYWSGLPFPSPGDLPDPGIEPRSAEFQADALTSEPPEKERVKKLA